MSHSHPKHQGLRRLGMLCVMLVLAACTAKVAKQDPASAPATPTGLTATPGNSQVALAWTADANATSYNVKRGTTTGGPYMVLASATSASYTDTTVTNGTTYFYVVSAVDATGESANSTEVSATPDAATSVPATPVGLAATAGDGQVSLTWTADAGATTYHVKRATTSGGPYAQVAAPTSPSDTDTTVTNGTKYFYVVSALNSAGESADSAEVNATPTARLQIPATPAGLAATAGNAQVSLTWSADAGATSYHVKRGTTVGSYTQIATTTSPSYTDSSVTNGTTYFYVVSALNGAGESANSSDVSASPDPAIMTPPVPLNLAASAGTAQVGLTWSASTGATSYHVKRATTSGGPYSQVAAPTSPAYTDTSVTGGTTYYYVVSAVDSAGESANSAQVSATPTAAVQIPAVPSGLAAVGATGQIGLTWSASSGATSYHVKRATASGGPYTQVAAPTSPSYTDTSVTGGTTYYYVVSALDSAGESADSAQVSAAATAPQVPAVPTGLAASPGDTQVSLSWSASSGATSYHVKRATTSGGPYSQVGAPTAISYNDTGLTDGTTYYYVVSAVNSAGESANSAQVSAMPVAASGSSVTVTVNPSSTAPISPYVYGINFSKSFLFPSSAPAPAGATIDRMGGDRLTAYNWTTNASNSGNDGGGTPYTNDNNFPEKNPGGAVLDFIAADRTANLATMITFQLQGLVAGDEAGAVSVANPPDLSRFKSALPAKGSAFSATAPSLSPVYMDEYAWFIDNSLSGQGIFTTTPTTLPVIGQLDNEPDLWSSTHKELGATEPTSVEFETKSIALATALKAKFPDMTLLGGVISGFYGLYGWNGKLPASVGGANWFVDEYAAAIKAANTMAGQTLVDVFDFHWYSQITDPQSGGSITGSNGASLTAAQVQAIVQSPRSLWDTTFKENSWITQAIGVPIYIIPRLQAKIAAANPGMKLAITEYYNGGGGHIAGTIAQADNLGIYGSYGLFAACIWPLGTDPYVVAAFKAYRNFDGAGHNFGDTSVAASSNNVANVAAYVSTDSTRPGRVIMVLINRSVTSQSTTVTGQPLSGTAHLFQITAATASSQQSNAIAPVAAGTQAASGSSITVTLPALSVTTIDVY